jgi:hypothetical protein
MGGALIYNMYKSIRPAIVTGIKNIKVNGKDTGRFSGFIQVRTLDTNELLDWVKWQNPLLGNTGYGVVTVPVVNQDCVTIGFDFRKRAYVLGMLTYNQALKTISDDTTEFNGESTDPRLAIKPGELMLRGSNKSSILFANDGSTSFKLDDTKADSDPTNTVIKIDSGRNITITNSNAVSVQCNSAEVTATSNVNVSASSVNIDSGNINLGIGGSPVLRVADVPFMTVLGTPGATPLPVVLAGPGSLTTKST